ncbi:MAG: hypothetical protein LPJ89_09935 [Hymenobacteraceae bacterium]|nr:hypothetical protein [Hymenobacteraceae bacterium]MDX5395023.1 hypothetical protein [Hymenobacteraceae bacterium]MDX5444087.1 hypothetical protein [Hymenobacteraceae bacterium]MDX5511057.1 hypothetical protein [Hymenobacteraceae bacterium]
MAAPKRTISVFEWTGYLLIITGLLILVWGFNQFNLAEQVSGKRHEHFGEYGEFIGGIVGSLWALAGVFLFFATLTYQKREFQLQREELQKTQKIFQQQNFSTLYISILTKHNDIVNALKAYDIEEAEWSGINFFILFKEKVLGSFTAKVRSLAPNQRTPEQLTNIFRDYFLYHFSFYQHSLNPYLNNLRVLFNMIVRYRTETLDSGEYYSFITKANLSQAELFLLYHIAYFNVLPDFEELSKEFDVYEKLPADLRVQRIVRNEFGDGVKRVV